MALVERIIGTAEPKIEVHQFQAALFEWELGAVTRADLIAAWNISAAEETELDWLKARYADAVTNGKRDTFKQVVDNVFLLGELGLWYTDQASIQARLLDASGP